MEEELQDDQQLLAELLGLLGPSAKNELIAKICIHTVVTFAGVEEKAMYRRSWPDGVPVEPAPEGLAQQFLERCMPTVPGSFCDAGFDREYQDRAGARLSNSCMQLVFTSSTHDLDHAAQWACHLSECAREIARSFTGLDAITDGDDPAGLLVDVDDVASFIRQWRSNFLRALGAARRLDD